MRDRLGSLTSKTPQPAPIPSVKANHVDNKDGEQEPEQKVEPDPFMEKLTATRRKIKENEKLLATLERHHRAVLAATDPDSELSAQQTLAKLDAQFQSASNSIRISLKQLTAEKTEDKRKKASLQSATKKFLEIVREFEGNQQQRKKAKEEQMARRIRIVRPNASDREVQRLIIEGDSNLESEFSPAHSPLLMAPGEMEARKKLAASEKDWMQARRDEMFKLEQGVQQVHQLMSDIALMVAQQGERVNRVEEYLQGAEEYVRKSKDVLKVSQVQHKKAQKRRVWTTIIIIVVIILLIGGLFFGNIYAKIQEFLVVLIFIGVVLAGLGIWYVWRKIKKPFKSMV